MNDDLTIDLTIKVMRLLELATEFAEAVAESANELSDDDLQDMADEFISNVKDEAHER